MSEDPHTPRSAKRHMLSWLSDVCYEAREAAGLTREDIASIGKLSYSKIYRFEEYADRWPRDIDHVLAAYAAALGMPDPRLLWLRAVERWLAHGVPLVLVDGVMGDGDEVVPPAALKAMEEAIGAYVRDTETEASHTGRGSRAAATRGASAKRARP